MVYFLFLQHNMGNNFHHLKINWRNNQLSHTKIPNLKIITCILLPVNFFTLFFFRFKLSFKKCFYVLIITYFLFFG